MRCNRKLNRSFYFAQSVAYSNFGSFRFKVKKLAKKLGRGDRLAVCCRIRNEAPFLAEWIEYYLAAGVDHFFFYEKLSTDNFQDVLQPFIDEGTITLFRDWPQVPISPSAEHDCILRSIGRFRWVGFLDADEFVVVRDGRSIKEFLTDFERAPAVALHWYMFGSNGHRTRPSGPVILEYDRRAKNSNRHVKCFVRPECVARSRNSHSWFYMGTRRAVNENGHPVMGSTSQPPSARCAWINHYHDKSDADYFEKASRKSVVDKVGMKFDYRSISRRIESSGTSNEIFDDSAALYYSERCRASNRETYLTAALAERSFQR